MRRHAPKLNQQRIQSAIMIREKGLAAGLSKEDLGAGSLASIVQLGVGLAQYASSADPADERIATGLAAAARAGSAMFAALGAAEPRDLLLYDGRTRRIPALAPSSSTAPMAWLRAFHAATCVGDIYALDRLAGADIALIRDSPTTTDEFGYLHIDALCGYHRRDADTPERLLAALKATDPDAVDPRLRNYVLDIATPQMELLFRLLKKDEAAFNQTLVMALEQHGKYYRRDQAPVLGQLALGPLALSCAAHDAGLAVTVESNYIPRWLIERQRPMP